MTERTTSETTPETTTNPDRDSFTLGPWTVIPHELRLQRTGNAREKDGAVRLQQKEMQLLLALADQEGRPLSSEALRQAVWGDQAITDGVAKNLVWQLRKSLGESADAPELIETVPGAGYRLTAKPQPVVEDDANGRQPLRGQPLRGQPQPDEASNPLAEGTQTGAGSRAATAGALAAVTVALVAVGIFFLVRSWPGDTQPHAPSSAGGEMDTLDSLFAPAMVPRLVVDLPGRESDLALDPDGRHLLFSHRGDSPAENLYVFDFDDPAEAPVQLTESPLADAAAAWSPDGRRIAFTRTEPGSGRYEIHVLPATGGESRRVANVLSARPVDLEWLDLDSLVMSRIPLAGGAGPGAQGLEVLDLATGDVTVLTRHEDGETYDRSPSLSPDGRRLAFARWRGSTSARVAVLDLASNDTRRVGPPMAGIQGLAWLAGSDRILFAGTESSLWRLWWLPADGSEPPAPFPATAGAMDVGEVATSRSGVVAYEQSVFDLDLLRLDVEGSGADLEVVGEPRRLVPSDRAETAAAPHPAGRGFAFLSDRSGPAALWISSGGLSGGDGPPRKLDVEGVTFGSHPTWSPDGTVVALSVRRDDQSEIALVRVEDGHVELATDTPRREVLPTWRADGLAIRFATPSVEAEGVFDLWEKELWRGDAARLLVPNALLSQPLPDGRLVACRNSGQLVIVDPARPDDARVLPIDLLPGDLGNWQATAEGVYWISVRTSTLRYFDFATETTTDLARIEHRAAKEALRISADGSHLYVSVLVRDDARILALRP